MELHKNLNQIDTFLLDMDGTLLDLNFDSEFWLKYIPECYAEKNRIERSEAKEILFKKMNNLRGTLDWYCLDFWSTELKLDVVALKHDLKHLIQPLPGTVEFLNELKRHKKKIVLTTNAHRGSYNLKMKVTKLERFFDRVISSHDLNTPKENPVFWKKLQKQIHFENSKTALIDDSEPVLKSAAEYGIETLFHVSKPSTKDKEVRSENFQSITNLDALLPMLK